MAMQAARMSFSKIVLLSGAGNLNRSRKLDYENASQKNFSGLLLILVSSYHDGTSFHAIDVDSIPLDEVLYNVLNKRFVMPRRLLMTGTPIQNNLSKLWAIMHFCAPLVFGKLEQFLFTFREAAGTSGEYAGSTTGTPAKEGLLINLEEGAPYAPCIFFKGS
ncbi:hypothetical protein Syun_006634 [Stephania yunnanensis]|uniref:SNF2 N-terminal domain-containing protein n=1 Tax=Stephania yunnanensis TaxID=152371 RepID=A0AAP0KYE7_9MAGN